MNHNMAKAPVKKEEEGLPDTQEQQRLVASVRAFASDPRMTGIRKAMQTLAAETPQSLLLEGGASSERAAAALYWAALLNCTNIGANTGANATAGPCLDCPGCTQISTRLHRDLFFFDGEAGSIKIDEIREMRSQLGEDPREGKMRVVVLFEGQALGEAAANALLKSLEEPRQGSVFVLTAPQRERLLPTLVSRSWVLTLPWPQSGEFSQLGDEELGQVSEWARALLNFAATGRGWMERTGRRGAMDARLCMQLLLYCQNALKDALGTDDSGPDFEQGAGLTPLAEAFCRLSPQGRHILSELLAECQDSLFYTVNPVLLADWLATRIFFLFAKERVIA